MLPGALITGLGIEFGHDLGANKEVSSVYSIRLSLEAGDDKQEAHWRQQSQSTTLPLHITMAVVRPNGMLHPDGMRTSTAEATVETSQKHSTPAFTLGAPYMQPLVVAPNINNNKRRRQTSATMFPSRRGASRVTFVTPVITPCMPMCKYISRGILTPLAHAHADKVRTVPLHCICDDWCQSKTRSDAAFLSDEQGILWAKAVVAHMQNNEREAVQCAKEIRSAMESATEDVRSNLMQLAEDQRSCASVLGAIEDRFLGIKNSNQHSGSAINIFM